jgi:23S rRNA (guanosine2251-2'-O)-methyltransferase
MPHRIIILDNIRSAENVGSIARTAEAAGVTTLVTIGITPHPRMSNDLRPGYMIAKVERALVKTALGAESHLTWEHFDMLSEAAQHYAKQQFNIYAVESQRSDSQNLLTFVPAFPYALVFGSETDGLEQEFCEQATAVLEIPMHGHKLSLNVSVSVGIALYCLTAF